MLHTASQLAEGKLTSCILFTYTVINKMFTSIYYLLDDFYSKFLCIKSKYPTKKELKCW